MYAVFSIMFRILRVAKPNFLHCFAIPHCCAGIPIWWDKGEKTCSLISDGFLCLIESLLITALHLTMLSSWETMSLDILNSAKNSVKLRKNNGILKSIPCRVMICLEFFTKTTFHILRCQINFLRNTPNNQDLPDNLKCATSASTISWTLLHLFQQHAMFGTPSHIDSDVLSELIIVVARIRGVGKCRILLVVSFKLLNKKVHLPNWIPTSWKKVILLK